MKKISLNLLALASLVLLLASCSGKVEEPKVQDMAGDLSDLPSWVLSPQSDEGVTAVGIAAPSRGGIQFQIPKAELDGKANIASEIQSKISRLTKSSLRSAGVNENEDVESFFAQATKEVVKDLPMSGVRRINTYRAKDGTLYVQMLLSNKDYTAFIENGQKTFESMLKGSNLGQNNIEKTQEATKALFDELDNQ